MLFTKRDLDALPFPDVLGLPATSRRAIRKLARQLENDWQKPWGEIDSFLFDLYGLDEDARQVARDTLFSVAAYRRQGRAALQQTMRAHRKAFCSQLAEILEPYFSVCGERVFIEDQPYGHQGAWGQPWRFIAISRADDPVSVGANLLLVAMEEANRSSASRIIVRAPSGAGLLLGLLNQQRWWTISRARLCGQHILRQHLDAFGLA
jgi:hypothetical protein